MFEELKMNLEYGNAICYSGYREGQCPGKEYPSYEEIKEDLLILAKNWQYLRLYDCTPHAETVLEVIAKESLDDPGRVLRRRQLHRHGAQREHQRRNRDDGAGHGRQERPGGGDGGIDGDRRGCDALIQGSRAQGQTDEGPA